MFRWLFKLFSEMFEMQWKRFHAHTTGWYISLETYSLKHRINDPLWFCITFLLLNNFTVNGRPREMKFQIIRPWSSVFYFVELLPNILNSKYIVLFNEQQKIWIIERLFGFLQILEFKNHSNSIEISRTEKRPKKKKLGRPWTIWLPSGPSA